MRIAVTGATGFIGRHVVRNLCERGIRPVLSARNPPAEDLGCEFITLDINNPPEDVFSRLKNPDVLIHLAWGGLPHYRSLHHFEQELPSQYRFLKLLIENGLRQLVIAGTCFEYGLTEGRLSEEMPTHPCTVYGLAKDTLRRALEFLQTTIPFQLTWARLFYLFGEDQSPNSLYGQLKKIALTGSIRFPMSGGEQLRDYLPVEEAARLLVDLAIRPQNCGIVNICSGQPISVRRLVERWIEERGWNIKLELGYYPYPDYEPMAFWGDRRKLDQILCKSIP